MLCTFTAPLTTMTISISKQLGLNFTRLTICKFMTVCKLYDSKAQFSCSHNNTVTAATGQIAIAVDIA